MVLGNPGKFASKLLFTYLWPSCASQKCQKRRRAHPLNPILKYINRVYGTYLYICTWIHMCVCMCMCVCSLFAVWNIFNLTLGWGPLAAPQRTAQDYTGTANSETATIKIFSVSVFFSVAWFQFRFRFLFLFLFRFCFLFSVFFDLFLFLLSLSLLFRIFFSPYAP